MARPGSSSPEAADPPRLWTAAEANDRLVDLAPLLPKLRAWAVRLGEVHAELHRLTAFWGGEVDAVDHVDHGRKSQLDGEWAHLSRRLEEAVDALAREGIQVKDLETGLVDFYGRVDGEIVFLCWRRGEPDVAHFHSLDGGFRSRRPLASAAHTTVPGGPGESA
jgi:hypothetical protein